MEIEREFITRLRRFIARRVRGAADVDDLLQDVLLKLHVHAAELPAGRGRERWAKRVARNAVIDHYRRRGRAEHPLEVDPAGTEPPARASLPSCLSGMLQRLSAESRQAIELFDMSGLTAPELAGRLRLSVSGAKSRVQRARRQMRRMLMDCCKLEFDARGNVIDHTPTDRARRYCGTAPPACGAA